MTAAVLVFTCTNATSAGSTHGAGINTITITGTKTSTAVLTGIALSGDYTTTFYQNGTFSYEGLIVTASYDDGTSSAVSGFTVSSPDMTTLGTQTVTVSYTEGNVTKTASYDITIEEAHDYATLPFSWAGGSSADLKKVLGVTVNCDGSDYSSTNNPYLVKFSKNGHYVMVKTDSRPGKVTVGVKMLGGSDATSITVQGSANGETFTDVQTLTISGAKNDILNLETTNSFAATDRYVRLYFNKGSGSNVGVGPISIALPSTDPEISANATLSLAFDATSGEIGYSIINPVDGVSLTATTEADWISDFVVAADKVNFTATANTGAERTATVTLTYSTATKDVTVTQAAYVDPNAPGTENNPYTVAQARAAIDAGTGMTGVYATGIVSEIVEAYNSQYGNITYNISTDGTTTADQLQAYRGKSYNGANFTSEDDIQVGDVVVIYGNLKKYIKDDVVTYEFEQNNQLVSLERKAVRYYLVGSFDNWLDGKVEMTKSGNTYTAEKAFEANTLFKIVKIDELNNNETTWYGGETNDESYGIHSGWYENIALIAGDNGKNFKIEAASDDKYTFTVNAENPDALTLTVTGWHVPVVKYYLAGNWSENWSDGKVELTENADGTFSTSKLVGNGSRFKFVKTVDNVETWYGATTTGGDYGINSGWCTDIELSDASNASAFVVQMASDHDLVFTLNVTDLKFNVTGWPISYEGNLFVKVTSTDDFTDGAYLIVNETAGVAFDGSLETLDAANNVINVKIVNNTIVANSKTKESLFTIVNNGKITSASGHYIGVGGQSNGLKLDESAKYYINSVTFDESGNADISINITGSTNYMHLKYNKGSNDNRFRYYKDGQQAIQLYKLVTATEIPVSVSAAGYATYCSENALDFSNVGGLKAYTAEISNNEVNFTEITEAIPANQGVLLKGAEGTYSIPVATSANAPAKNDFIGVTEATKINETGIFVLMSGDNGVGFYKTNDAFTVGANTAYLPALAGGNGGARTFIGFDEATGIANLNANANLNGEVYNLQGQRVVAPQKGLYIVNGKKVVIK